MRIPESELIINSDGSAFHLHIRPEQLADNVVLVGDPGRVAMAASHLDSIEAEGASREFVWATGFRRGVRFTILSTGIGADNIDIVMTELDALANIDFTTREVKPEHRTLNILRIGTCGAIQPDIPIGAFIFSHISIGMRTATRCACPILRRRSRSTPTGPGTSRTRISCAPARI